MKKLCFGSYATVLKRCMAKSATQKRLCGMILLSIAPEYDIRDDDGVTSDLVLGKKNLSSYVTDPAPTADAHSVSDYFKQNILPMLDGNKRSLIVLALKDIVASDDSIEPDTVMERVNGMTKADITRRDAFVLEDFLVGIFLYTAANVENSNCQDSVKEITDEYIQSFDVQKTTIAFLTSYSSFSTKTAEEITIDAHALALLTETGGKCQKCGRPLGIKKEGNDINYAKVVRLSENEEAVLCVDCERELRNAPNSVKQELIAEKRSLEQMVAATDATSRISIEREIETVLRQISSMEIICDDETKLKFDPIPIEKKIPVSLLRDKVVWNAKYWYKAVNTPLDQLAGESKLNVDRFAKSIKRMYEDASVTLASQSAIYNLLVETLFDKTGRKYKEACEIIISYFVQRCEVFDEIAK